MTTPIMSLPLYGRSILKMTLNFDEPCVCDRLIFVVFIDTWYVAILPCPLKTNQTTIIALEIFRPCPLSYYYIQEELLNIKLLLR